MLQSCSQSMYCIQPIIVKTRTAAHKAPLPTYLLGCPLRLTACFNSAILTALPPSRLQGRRHPSAPYSPGTCDCVFTSVLAMRLQPAG